MTDNEIIAEFMGTKHRKCYGPFTGAEYTEIRDGYKWILCRYNNSWDALMPVVEKIESLDYFVMINKWTSVYTGGAPDGVKGDRIIITTVEGPSKLTNTYQAVLAFIKWYNEQTKSK